MLERLVSWLGRFLLPSPAPAHVPPPAPAPPPAPCPDPMPLATDDTTSLLLLHARQRNASGLGPLASSAALAAAAQAHAAAMAAHHPPLGAATSHQLPGEATLAARLTAAGYRPQTWGENVAGGQRTADDAFAAWMRSPGHRANILREAFTEVGFGVATAGDGTRFWAADFGRPAPGPGAAAGYGDSVFGGASADEHLGGPLTREV